MSAENNTFYDARQDFRTLSCNAFLRGKLYIMITGVSTQFQAFNINSAVVGKFFHVEVSIFYSHKSVCRPACRRAATRFLPFRPVSTVHLAWLHANNQLLYFVSLNTLGIDKFSLGRK